MSFKKTFSQLTIYAVAVRLRCVYC